MEGRKDPRKEALVVLQGTVLGPRGGADLLMDHFTRVSQQGCESMVRLE